MDKYKPLLASKTIYGVLLMLLAPLFPRLGIISSDEISNVVSLVLDAAGAIMAIYGRVNADAKIKGVVSSDKK